MAEYLTGHPIKEMVDREFNQISQDLDRGEIIHQGLKNRPVGSVLKTDRGWVIKGPDHQPKIEAEYICEYIHRLERSLVVLPQKIQEAELKFQNITTEQFLRIKLKRLKATFNWKMHLVKYRIKSTFRRVFK